MKETKLNLAAFPGWPSKDNKPVLQINLLLSELEEKFGFSLIRDEDDLGFFTATHYLDEVIGPVAFFQYDYLTPNTTILYIDSKVNLETAVNRIKNALEINDEHIIWSVLS